MTAVARSTTLYRSLTQGTHRMTTILRVVVEDVDSAFRTDSVRRINPKRNLLILWRSQPDSNRCTSLERAMSWASRRWERRGVYPQEPGIIVAQGAL
jgi:hypothetical protein